MSSSNPTQSLVDLFNDKSVIINFGSALDMGCGKGRNSIYLAKMGFNQVIGIDYVQHALDIANQFAINEKVENKCEFVLGRIDQPLWFEEKSFDFILDSYSSIDIETKEGRVVCRNEMFRVLKPGGYVLVLVVSCNDEMEKEFIQLYPGLEPNSCYWPINNKFQKDYDYDELIQFYQTIGFVVVDCQRLNRKASKLGKSFIDETFCLILSRL